MPDHTLIRANNETMLLPKPGWVIVAQPGIKIDVPGAVEINGQTTLACVDGLSERAWQHISTGPIFQELFKDAYTDENGPLCQIPKTVEELKAGDNGVKHVSGMIIQACEAIFEAHDKKQGVKIFFREPEAHLHPKIQRCLVQMINKIRRMAGIEVSEPFQDEPEKPKKRKKKGKDAKRATQNPR